MIAASARRSCSSTSASSVQPAGSRGASSTARCRRARVRHRRRSMRRIFRRCALFPRAARQSSRRGRRLRNRPRRIRIRPLPGRPTVFPAGPASRRVPAPACPPRIMLSALVSRAPRARKMGLERPALHRLGAGRCRMDRSVRLRRRVRVRSRLARPAQLRFRALPALKGRRRVPAAAAAVPADGRASAALTIPRRTAKRTCCSRRRARASAGRSTQPRRSQPCISRASRSPMCSLCKSLRTR